MMQVGIETLQVEPVALVQPTASLQFSEHCQSSFITKRIASMSIQDFQIPPCPLFLPHVPSPSADLCEVVDVNDMASASTAALDVVCRGIFGTGELHVLVSPAMNPASLIFSRSALHKRVYEWCEVPTRLVGRRRAILDGLLHHFTVMEVPMHIAERLFCLSATSPTECIALLERQGKIADWYAEKLYGSP